MPSSRLCRGPCLLMLSPSSQISPAEGLISPSSALISSVWPLPWTPATASTSPARASKLTSRTTGTPRESTTLTPRASSTGLPTSAGGLSTRSLTERPTIISASSASEAVGGAVPTTLPRRITLIRSPIALTSRSLWVMKMIEVPRSLRARMISISSSISCGVSTAVGSSRISTWASLASALMISTRCWTPTGMSSIKASGLTASL